MTTTAIREGFPPCELCGEPVLVTAKRGWLRGVKGWEQPRSGGGAHGIVRREVDGRFAHERCVRDEVPAGRSLFE